MSLATQQRRHQVGYTYHELRFATSVPFQAPVTAWPQTTRQQRRFPGRNASSQSKPVTGIECERVSLSLTLKKMAPAAAKNCRSPIIVIVIIMMKSHTQTCMLEKMSDVSQ